MGGEWALAFVVGGSEGIGLAIAQALVRQGVEVAIFGRSEDKLRAAGALLDTEAADASGATTYAGRLDVRDAAATAGVLDEAVAALGVPDLVVTTAGFARAEWFAESPLDNARAMIETNYLGTVHVCHALVPHLVAAGRGTIVTTSSMAGLTGVYGYTGYSASKFAVVGFSEALRRELHPHGIHVATLCPPNTRTPGFDEENRTKPREVLAAEEKVKTLEPAQVAEHLLKVLPSRPKLVIPGFDSRLGHRVIRHLPWVAERMLRRRG
jgi:3-dehydrosphinganine reductase